jgi:hypothetical protein
VRVLVVWEPVLPTDVAPPVAGALGLITDGRVAQYWDAGRSLSNDLVRSVNAAPNRYGLREPLPSGFIAWDVVAVFGPGEHWAEDVPVPDYYGGPVVDVIDPAREAIVRALRPAVASGGPAPRN